MVRKRIVLLRSDNRLVVDPSTAEVRRVLEPQLTYHEKKSYHGGERWRRKHMGLPLFEEIPWECFGDDHKGRLGTSLGFRERILEALRGRGFEVVERFATPQAEARHHARQDVVYRPRWDRIEEMEQEGFVFRYQQREALELIAKHENGRIDCHGGWGKGTLIMLACKLFPRAQIAVVTKRVPVLHDRLLPELGLNLPSVGVVGGGKKVRGRRVMCYSADSLHHASGEEDIVFVDEGHEACADAFAQSLAVFDHARMWGFSASWDMRPDNKDLRGEAIFGPIRLRVPYETGVQQGIVVPIEIIWSDVVEDVNPVSGVTDPVEKKRRGVWANRFRNKIIARDVRLYDRGTQVLVAVETLEHALYLRQELPEAEVIYAPSTQTPQDWEWFRGRGLLWDGFRPMTRERLERLTRRYEAGTLDWVIVTKIWNVGVNFRRLQVLVRADASSSPVVSTQLPARNARPHLDGWDKKQVAIVHDYKDQFDVGFRRKAQKRAQIYELHKWAQNQPPRRSALRQKMSWGDAVE